MALNPLSPLPTMFLVTFEELFFPATIVFSETQIFDRRKNFSYFGQSSKLS